jgi:hypothetical protein
MILDQWGVVTSGVTQIDRLKGEDHNSPSHDINEVFGTRSFDSSWLLPTKAIFPGSIRDDILGYCIPCAEEEREGLLGREVNINIV